MRSRLAILSLILYFAVAMIGCTSKPAADNSSTPDNGNSMAGNTADSKGAGNGGKEARERREGKESREAKEAKEMKKEPLVVPTGTSITVSLGSAIGSKLSQPGQTFNGSVAKDVTVGTAVVIPQGAAVSGTVTDAKPLGKFAGGAALQVRLDSITINGVNLPVQATARSFSAKGKGKRTGVMAGGGAVLGGIIGGIAGGGKGAAIGMLAGGGAGGAGAAFTGNEDIVLPAESDVAFELSQPLEIK
jgi:hypothetical protein